MSTNQIEALIGPFITAQNARVVELLKNTGPYVIAPSLRAEAGEKPFLIYGFIDPDCTHVYANGATVEEALAAFLIRLKELRVDKPAELRAKASKLLAEASALEGGVS